MTVKIELLLRNEAIESGVSIRLLKNKAIYQLKNTGDDKYTLTQFDKITLKGNLDSYLKENGIVLCYIVDANDTELRSKCDSLIKKYGQDGDGELTRIYDKVKVKKH